MNATEEKLFTFTSPAKEEEEEKIPEADEAEEKTTAASEAEETETEGGNQ